MSKEIFYLQITKPEYSFSFSLLSDGKTHILETASAKKQKTEKHFSEPEQKTFFLKLEKLGFYSWPPNMDCCACDDSSWVIMADHEGKKKRCFGVFGFEPDSWPDLIRLIEGYIDKKLHF